MKQGLIQWLVLLNIVVSVSYFLFSSFVFPTRQGNNLSGLGKDSLKMKECIKVPNFISKFLSLNSCKFCQVHEVKSSHRSAVGRSYILNTIPLVIDNDFMPAFLVLLLVCLLL